MPPYPQTHWTDSYEDVQFEHPAFAQPPRPGSPTETTRMLGNVSDVDHIYGRNLPPPVPPKHTPLQPPKLPHAATSPLPIASSSSLPGTADAELGFARPRAQRTVSARSFVPSRMNPYPGAGTPPHRFSSYQSTTSNIAKLASEDSRVLSWSPSPSSASSRASMILYRVASKDDAVLLPPQFPGHHRSSTASSRDSMISLSDDSKYPVASMMKQEHGLVPYAYDPALDDADNEQDALHDPKVVLKHEVGSPWRGIVNISGLVCLLLALLGLFIVYPVVLSANDDPRASRIVNNIRINSTGQAVEADIPVGRRSQTLLSVPLLYFTLVVLTLTLCVGRWMTAPRPKTLGSV